MRRILVVMAVLLAAATVQAAGAAGGGGARGSTPKTQSFWLCFLDRYEQGVTPVEAALDCDAEESEKAPGEAEPSGLMGPFGTVIGGSEPGWSTVQVSCGGGDSRIAGGGGEAATKAEIDKMLLQAWKDYLEARNKGDNEAAAAALAERARLKAARGYAPEGRVGPISEEQCQELGAALRELSHQVQVCDQNGWQSTSTCRELAAKLFGCADPTVSLTTGDYECGGKPSQAELDAAAERAYELCSELRQGGSENDPCKPIAFDEATVRSVRLAKEVCNNPYAHWDGVCGEPADLGAWLDGLVKDLSPSVVDTLDEMCVKLGQSECPRPSTDDDPPFPDVQPRPKP
jgi:hypothetical protein